MRRREHTGQLDSECANEPIGCGVCSALANGDNTQTPGGDAMNVASVQENMELLRILIATTMAQFMQGSFTALESGVTREENRSFAISVVDRRTAEVLLKGLCARYTRSCETSAV